MDWNWFFSSVAQSVAALDGTLVAFTIAKVLNNQAAFQARVSRSAALVESAERIRDAASVRYFDWYNERTLENSFDAIAGKIHPSTAPGVAEKIANQIRLPAYLSREDAISAIQQMLAELARVESERQQRRSTNPFGPPSDYPMILSPTTMQTQALREDSARQELEQEAEAIRQIELEAKANIRSMQTLRSEMAGQPERSVIVRVTLAVALGLFCIGVIYPLSFLPLPTLWTPSLTLTAFFPLLLSIRGAMLALPAVSFGGLLLVLAVINERLYYTEGLLSRLDKWLPLEAYSPFFAVAEQNRQLKSSAP